MFQGRTASEHLPRDIAAGTELVKMLHCVEELGRMKRQAVILGLLACAFLGRVLGQVAVALFIVFHWVLAAYLFAWSRSHNPSTGGLHADTT